jgi:acetyl-CoA carboxylase carboxyltransferase component
MTAHLHAVEQSEVEALVACDAHVSPAMEPMPSDSPLRPLQRLQLLCDEGSLQVVRSSATSERMGDKARPGDGVVGASGTVAGRPVYCFAQDASFAGGSVGAAHAETIVRVQRLARKARVPVIGFVESGGARMQEGLAALGGWPIQLSSCTRSSSRTAGGWRRPIGSAPSRGPCSAKAS